MEILRLARMNLARILGNWIDRRSSPTDIVTAGVSYSDGERKSGSGNYLDLYKFRRGLEALRREEERIFLRLGTETGV